MELVTQALIALVPSIGVGFLFYKIIKAIVESDRSERLAYAQWQAEQKGDVRGETGTTDRLGSADERSPRD